MKKGAVQRLLRVGADDKNEAAKANAKTVL